MLPVVSVARRVLAVLVIVAVGALGVAALALGARPPAAATPLGPLRLNTLTPRLEGTRLVQPLPGGGYAQLTLDPDMQEVATRVLAQANAASGALVLLSV